MCVSIVTIVHMLFFYISHLSKQRKNGTIIFVCTTFFFLWLFLSRVYLFGEKDKVRGVSRAEGGQRNKYSLQILNEPHTPSPSLYTPERSSDKRKKNRLQINNTHKKNSGICLFCCFGAAVAAAAAAAFFASFFAGWHFKFSVWVRISVYVLISFLQNNLRYFCDVPLFA